MTSSTDRAAVYGAPPTALADTPPGAIQVSPRSPGAPGLETLPAGSLDRLIVVAPDGVIERRFVMAAGLVALREGGQLTILAPKTKGGSRLAKELAAFGALPVEDYRRGWRICRLIRPAALEGLDGALSAGAVQQAPGVGWTQPGVFSWNRPDPGSALLAQRVGALAGRGADLGGGTGLLAKAVLASGQVESLLMIEIDRRAVEAAQRNIADARLSLVWADVLAFDPPSNLDFVVMNPPFHDAGTEDHGLGLAFIRRAAGMLRRGGVLYMVANRHLPYEAALDELFARFSQVGDGAGFKLIEAVK